MALFLGRRTSGWKRLGRDGKRACSHLDRTLRIEPLEERSLLSAGGLAMTDTLPSDGLTPAQISHAYGFDKIVFSGGIKGDGSGQTIAIVDELDDPKLLDSSDANFAGSDLHTFDLQFGIAEHAGFFTKYGVDQSGNATTALPAAAGNSGLALETSMDVEWAHALAPGANIVLIEANSDNQIVTAMSAAANISGVSVVSLSFGAPEDQAASLGWYPAFDTIGADHPDVTFVVSSGDQHNGEMVDYPSTSPWALSVGATAFYSTTYPVVDAAGDYVHEEAWNQDRSDATGGGPSTLFTAPSWQSGITNSSYRVTPDVSFHGYGSCYVYDSYDYPSSPWVEGGGTSMAAPSWAALIAIANQGASNSGHPDLGHSAIPALYATYQNSNWYAMAFHDITAGNNYYYPATTGYDDATGLGTPYADAIAEWLGQNVSAPSLSSPSGPFVYTTGPTFTWAPVANAVSYNAVLTDNTTGVSVTLQAISTDSTTGELSVSAAAPLVSGDNYTFSVSSQFPNLSNPGGGTNLESSIASSTTFTVLTSLAVPTLSWPVGNSSSPITVLLTPTASWSAVSGATGYDLDLVDQTTAQTILSSVPVSGTSYTPSTPLTAGDVYQWRVMAVNDSTLQSAWSDYAYTIAEATIPVLSIANVTQNEGDSGTTTFDFTVSITGSNTLATTVNFATADGTATAGSDYVAASGTLTWAAGDTAAKTISVTVNGDTTVEPDETFYVNLSSPTNATLANSTATGTIVNDDLSVSSVAVTSQNGTLQSNEMLAITWTTSSAYSLASQTLTVDGEPFTSITGPSGGTNYSCTIGTWSVGSHSYAIQATDSKGVSGTATGTFNVVAPPASDPVIGLVTVSQGKGVISWNVVDADGVAGTTLAIDGKAVSKISGPYTASSGVNYSAPLGSLSTGNHTYTITATDKLGNQSTASQSFTITSQGPVISLVAVSEARGRISWNAADPDGVAGSSVTIDGKVASSISGPFAASSGVNYSAPLGTLAAGSHNYTITAVDKLGNPSTLTGSFTLTNAVPAGPTISLVTVSEAKARITWNALDANGVKSSTLQIDGTSVPNVAGPYQWTSGVNFSAPLGTLAAGSHNYTITATDGAGSVSTATGSFTLTNATSTGPTISMVTVSEAKARISWNALDADGVNSSTLQIDGISVPNVSGPYQWSSGVNFSAPLGTLAAGSHNYKITATDGAGNVSTLSGSFTLQNATGSLNALATAASLSNLSNSAKVDWLYDLGGLSDDAA